MVFLCVYGVLISLVIAQFLPELISLRLSGDWQFGKKQSVIAALWVVLFAMIGVAVAILAQPNSAPDALRDGLAWQGLIGGALRSGQAGFNGVEEKRRRDRERELDALPRLTPNE